MLVNWPLARRRGCSSSNSVTGRSRRLFSTQTLGNRAHGNIFPQCCFLPVLPRGALKVSAYDRQVRNRNWSRAAILLGGKFHKGSARWNSVFGISGDWKEAKIDEETRASRGSCSTLLSWLAERRTRFDQGTDVCKQQQYQKVGLPAGCCGGSEWDGRIRSQTFWQTAGAGKGAARAHQEQTSWDCLWGEISSQSCQAACSAWACSSPRRTSTLRSCSPWTGGGCCQRSATPPRRGLRSEPALFPHKSWRTAYRTSRVSFWDGNQTTDE